MNRQDSMLRNAKKPQKDLQKNNWLGTVSKILEGSNRFDGTNLYLILNRTVYIATDSYFKTELNTE